MMTVDKKVKLFLGTGGVGKTTLASLYAIKLARENPSKTVKLVTIDPSKRLKDYFELSEELTKREIGNLTIEINGREDLFKAFVVEALEGDQIEADKVFKNAVFQKLLGGLSVSQEFTSLYEVQKIKSNKFDFLIVDTPPLQNAGAFLSGAETLENLFSSSLSKFFIPAENQGVLFKLFFGVRKKALSILGSLTGNAFVKELNDFFVAVERIRPELLEVLRSSKDILRNKTEIALVCNENELSIAGLKLSLRSLKKEGLASDLCYLNNAKSSGELSRGVRERFEKLHSENKQINFKKISTFKKSPFSYESLMEVETDVEL